jgi:hypothetical protein
LGYEVTLTSFYEAFHIEKMKSWQPGQSGRDFLQRESFAAMKRAANAATRTTSPIVSARQSVQEARRHRKSAPEKPTYFSAKRLIWIGSPGWVGRGLFA